jgi:copper resistance protein C
MTMTRNLPRAAALVGITTALLLAASQAWAHAHLDSTTPAADSTVSSPKTIQAHFSKAIEFKLSNLKLTTSDGAVVPVMSKNDAKDPATLSIMPTAALKPGSYTVTWSAVSDDGHKAQGTFSFIVQ